jgi:predicted nucleotidyltransferase
MNTRVHTKADVVNRIRAAEATMRALGVVRIGLFGSFVNSTPSADSDIDLLVEFRPDRHSFDAFMELSFCLEDLLGRRIEIVTPQSLSRHIAANILREVEDVIAAA